MRGELETSRCWSKKDGQPSVAPLGHRSRKVASRDRTNQSGKGEGCDSARRCQREAQEAEGGETLTP